MNGEQKKCRFHPERPARIFCTKFEHGYCEECMEAGIACSDPKLYCRHRTSCVIWELQRGRARQERENSNEKNSSHDPPSAGV